MPIQNLMDIAPDLVPYATLAVLVVLLVVAGFGLIELRRIRRRYDRAAEAPPDRTDMVIGELRLLRNALEEVGPMRYAVAGLLAVRHEHRLETADIRADVAEILEEWQAIDRSVREIAATVKTVSAEVAGR